MTVSAVIGANFGDEGKGLVTDYLSTPETLVVRFNGGSQAGHTVVDPDGRRHVFHHFGSGSFRGAETFLSRFFIVNPIMFGIEHRELLTKGLKPKIRMDPDCPLTTPFDMMLNQAAETARGGNRHGSCGLGINETIVRNEHSEYKMTVASLFAPTDSIMARLKRIRDEWVPRRAAELGVKDLPLELNSERLLLSYKDDYGYMLHANHLATSKDTISSFGGNVVFEGAQGLGLDEKSVNFPYVTRSRTGLTNVIALLSEAGRSDPVDVYYVTRPYVTRHGAGPLKHEVPNAYFDSVVDLTNVHNVHQGTIRYGWFDVDAFKKNVLADYSQASGRARLNLAITCLDQFDALYPGGMRFSLAGNSQCLKSYEFPAHLRDTVKSENVLFSIGPTRHDVRVIENHSLTFPSNPGVG